MSHHLRRAAKVDSNQKEIVKILRQLGISVALGHDDLLVGYKGKTFWFELKASEKASKQPGQIKLNNEWRGHYKIVWNLKMILDEIGFHSDIK